MQAKLIVADLSISRAVIPPKRIRVFNRFSNGRPDPSNEIRSSSSSPARKTRRARKVAIVDDVAELTGLYSMALRLQGHEIAFIGSSGEEVVEAAKEGKLDSVEYVIIDYNMGGLNGLKAAEEIVRHNPRIVIIVASADRTIQSEVESQGFKYMSKPFTMSELIDCIV